MRVELILRAIDKASPVLRRVAGAMSKLRDRGYIASFEDIGRRISGVTKGLYAIGKRAVLAGTAAAGAVGALARAFGLAGDAAAKTADKLGVGIEWLQRYRYAAGLAGVEAGTFDMALQRFTRRAAEAAIGTGEAVDALDEMGIQLRDPEGRMRSSEALLADVADAMAAIDDPAKRLRLAFKLFDSEGVAMVNMLGNGSAAMRATAAEADRLGIVIGEDAARQSEVFNDNLTRLYGALTGVGRAIGGQLIPVLTPLIAKMTEWIIAHRDLVSVKFKEYLDKMIAAAPGVLRAIGDVASAFTGLVDSVRSLGENFGWLLDIGEAVYALSQRLLRAWGGVGRTIAGAAKAVGGAVGGVSRFLAFPVAAGMTRSPATPAPAVGPTIAGAPCRLRRSLVAPMLVA